MVKYNEKLYVVTGFIFPNAEFPNVEKVELYISQDTGTKEPKIILIEDDFEKIPKIKRAIEEIGSQEVHAYEHVGMPENEWNQYRKWFDEKFVKGYTYFKYGDKIYSPTFAIC